MRPATSFSRLRSLSDRGNLRKEFYEETPLPQQLDVFPSLLISYIDVDKMHVCRRSAALFFPDARLTRRPSPIDVALKVGWS